MFRIWEQLARTGAVLLDASRAMAGRRLAMRRAELGSDVLRDRPLLAPAPRS